MTTAWTKKSAEGIAGVGLVPAVKVSKLEPACSTCGAASMEPCRQVGPGGGDRKRGKVGIVMVTVHAARRRARSAVTP